MVLVASCVCGKQFQVPPHLAGKRVACPACGQVLTVPAVRPAAPAAAAGLIAVACQCGGRFAAHAHLAGLVVRCPKCRQPLRVPAPGGPRSALATSPAIPVAAGLWKDFLPGQTAVAVKPEGHGPHGEEVLSGPRVMAYAVQQAASGMSPKAVWNDLVSKGVSTLEADRVMGTIAPEGTRGSLKSSHSYASPRSDGIFNMAVGGTCFVVGIGVTMGTFMMAAPGGTFVLAWGAIIFGGIQFLGGLIQVATES